MEKSGQVSTFGERYGAKESTRCRKSRKAENRGKLQHNHQSIKVKGETEWQKSRYWKLKEPRKLEGTRERNTGVESLGVVRISAF